MAGFYTCGDGFGNSRARVFGDMVKSETKDAYFGILLGHRLVRFDLYPRIVW